MGQDWKYLIWINWGNVAGGWGNSFPIQIIQLSIAHTDYLVTSTSVRQVPRAVERLLIRDFSVHFMCPQS